MRTSVHGRSLFALRSAAGLPCPVFEHLESRALLSTTFGPMPVVTNGPQIYGQVVADFDGDGVNDVAGLDANAPSSILFFKGRGDGSFDAAKRTDLHVRVSAIGAGQLLPEGGVELVAVGGAGTPIGIDPSVGGYRATFVRVLGFDAASGKLRVVSTGIVGAGVGGDRGASTPIVGDFTGDGVAEIAFAPSSDKGRIVVMELAGAGLRLAATFAIPTPVGRSGQLPGDPIGADLNGDGRLDIVSFTSDGYVALMNSPSGLSATAITLALSKEIDWKFADVDGDGKADAVGLWMSQDQRNSAAADRSAEVRFEKGLGGGAFGAMQTIGRVLTGAGSGDKSGVTTDREWLLVGQDIDHDGLGDIVYVHDFDGLGPSGHDVRERVVVITHGMDGAWSVPNFALGPNERMGPVGDGGIEILGGRSEIVVDLNGDGRADLLDFGAGPIRGYLSSEVVSLTPDVPKLGEREDAMPEAAVLSIGRAVIESQRVVLGAGVPGAGTKDAPAAAMLAALDRGVFLPDASVRTSGQSAALDVAASAPNAGTRAGESRVRRTAVSATSQTPGRIIERREERADVPGVSTSRVIDTRAMGVVAGPMEFGPVLHQGQAMNRVEMAADRAAATPVSAEVNLRVQRIGEQPLAASVAASGVETFGEKTLMALRKLIGLGRAKNRRQPKWPMVKGPERAVNTVAAARAGGSVVSIGGHTGNRMADDGGEPSWAASDRENISEGGECAAAHEHAAV